MIAGGRLETYPQTLPAMEIEEIKSIKYQRALKAIEEGLINWAYDCKGQEFQYFVDGVIAVTKDWSDEDDK